MRPARPQVLGLAALPTLAAATRHRLDALRDALDARGLGLCIVTLLENREFERWYADRSQGRRAARLLFGALRMSVRALSARAPAVIFVQREACLAGPEVIERAALAWHGCPLVFDLDDAVWLPQHHRSSTPLLSAALRSTGKTERLLRRADLVVAGSRYLETEAVRRGARRTVYAPTVVDLARWRPLPERASGALRDPSAPVIGWVGTHTTAPQLELAAPALRRLRAEGHRFRVRVVGAGPGFTLPGLEIETAPWRESTEIADFQSIDIGLAPMYDMEWTRGKCAFKQIQYMSVGVPFVTSPIGATREVVDDGVEGLYATNDQEWYDALHRLLVDDSLRARLSAAGRARAERELGRDVVASRVADAIADLVGRQAASRDRPMPQGMSEGTSAR